MTDFERAVEDMNTKLAKTMTDEDLIEIYGLYKQATVGDINIDKPSEADVKGTAYWSAWNSRKGMSQEEAREEYVVAVRAMDPKHGSRCGTCVARKKV